MASTITTPNAGVFSGLRNGLAGFFQVLARNSQGWACAREVERLSALSDAELAKLGLTRDRIVQHAFASFLAH